MIKIIGEILSLISASTEVYERGARTYKKSIEIGVIRYSIQLLAYAFLGGINGMIITLMALVRHLFMYYKKFTGKVVMIWIILCAAMSLYFASTLADLFPFIATIQFTLMVKKQNVTSLKYAQIVNTLIWSVYHISHRTYVYLLFDIVLIITSAIRLKKGVAD